MYKELINAALLTMMVAILLGIVLPYIISSSEIPLILIIMSIGLILTSFLCFLLWMFPFEINDKGEESGE